MLIAALVVALRAAAPAVVRDSTCADIAIVADDVDFGGHRYDAPEHVRELRAPALAGRPHLWLLDTALDGTEHYDTVAMTLTADPTGAPDEFIPLRTIDWSPADGPRRVRICWP